LESEVKKEELNVIPMELSKQSLLEILCGNGNGNVSARTKANADKAIADIRLHADIKAVYQIFKVENCNGQVTLGNGISFRTKKLANALRSCKHVVVFFITLGKEVDRLIKRNMRKRSHYAYILDIAASMAAESTAEFLQSKIKKNIGDDQGITLRYSPGYCDWPVEEQRKLFDLLPADSVEISLSEKCFMSPRKSISGIIGIGPKHRIEKQKNTCIHCNKNECTFRREIISHR
jgi:hypothetical protein